MTARIHRLETTEQPQPRKLVRPPEFDPCNFYVEVVNPAFDPKRVLLRGLFFINVDRTRYVSVGFFPTRDYQPFLEFGTVKNNGPTFIILNDQQVNKMAECLPIICESICGNEQYVYKDGDFRLNSTGNYRVARLYLEKRYISLRLADLQYLQRMFHVVQNQLNVYTLSLRDVLSYVILALTSAN